MSLSAPSLSKSPPMEFLTFFIWLHYVTTSLGIFLNIVLLILIVYKTPNYLKTYSIFIFNFALTDFGVCLSDMFTQPRVIPCGLSVAYFSSGPCKYISDFACYIGYDVMMHFYAHSLWSLLASFSYRYYILKKKQPTKSRVLLLLFVAYIPSLFQVVTFAFASASREEVVQMLSRYNYDFSEVAISGNAYIFEWKTAYTMFHMTLPISPIYTLILVLRKKTLNTLLRHNKMSLDVKNMHSLLLKALTLQACLPILYSIGVVAYGLGQTGLLNHPGLEYLTFMSFLFLPVLSPLCSIYFVKPYRNTIINCTPWKNRIYTSTELSNFPSSQRSRGVNYLISPVFSRHSSTQSYSKIQREQKRIQSKQTNLRVISATLGRQDKNVNI